MSALEKLKQLKQGADQSAKHRENFNRFVVLLPEEERLQYAENIKVLFGNDESAALSLFPPGLYESAEQARQSARECWQEFRKERR